MSKSRSCVIGRGVEAPWSFIRIAAASGYPIQIGRNLFVSTALSSTIGCFPTMSQLTPELPISCKRALLHRGVPDGTVWQEEGFAERSEAGRASARDGATHRPERTAP